MIEKDNVQETLNILKVMEYKVSQAIACLNQEDMERKLITDTTAIQIACKVLNTSEGEMKTGKRTFAPKYARWFCYYYWVNYQSVSLVRAGSILGQDHSTVVHALKTLENDINFSPDVRILYNKFIKQLIK